MLFLIQVIKNCMQMWKKDLIKFLTKNSIIIAAGVKNVVVMHIGRKEQTHNNQAWHKNHNHMLKICLIC